MTSDQPRKIRKVFFFIENWTRLKIFLYFFTSEQETHIHRKNVTNFPLFCSLLSFIFLQQYQTMFFFFWQQSRIITLGPHFNPFGSTNVNFQ